MSQPATAAPAAPEELMLPALGAARAAAQEGEVPVGAALYSATGDLIAAAANRTLADTDPSAHAEICCLRAAAKKIGNHRLVGSVLAVTLEPCAMCAGAIMHARVAKVYFGAADPKAGACGSVVDLFAEPRLNHHAEVIGGVCAKECAGLLSSFFAERR